MASERATRLDDARLYLCTDSRRRQGDLEQFLDAVLAAGVDVVQLREKGLDAREEIELAGRLDPLLAQLHDVDAARQDGLEEGLEVRPVRRAQVEPRVRQPRPRVSRHPTIVP